MILWILKKVKNELYIVINKKSLILIKKQCNS